MHTLQYHDRVAHKPANNFTTEHTGYKHAFYSQLLQRNNKWPTFFISDNYDNTIVAIVLSQVVRGYKEQLQKANNNIWYKKYKNQQHMAY